MDLDFANLPYLYDGEVKLTESSAIMRYIANQYGPEGFSGKSDAEKAHVDMIFGVVSDIKG
jgi:glutathione S-transferase